MPPLAPVPSRARRLVFLGTPGLAVPFLSALVDAGFDVPLVVSRADRRRGRGTALSPSPVKAAAVERGIPVTSEVGDVLSVDAELGVVVAFGRLIPTPVLEQLPMVNIHFSLLPRWRGAAPVERALLAGDERTGVCLMQVVEALDAGPVYDCRPVDIAPDATLETLRAELVEAGVELLVRSLSDGLPEPREQEGDAVYAHKIDPDELHLDWTRPATELARVVRLGGAWTTFRGHRLKVLDARATDPVDGAPGQLQDLVVATGSGGLELVEVQPEGRRRQPAEAWRNGAHPDPGEHLGG